MPSVVFCLTCFSTMPPDGQTCPACGQGVAAASARDYRKKLTRALQHPLADVRMRAIIALGLRGEASAAIAECQSGAAAAAPPGERTHPARY